MPASKIAKLQAKLTESLKDGMKTRDVRVSELLAHFLDEVGGPKKVASMLAEEFKKSPPGGVVRQRILDMILRMTKMAQDAAPQLDDLSLISDADINREVCGLLEYFASDASFGTQPGQAEGQQPPQGVAAHAAAGAGPEESR
jgi:hypothetical protein